MGGRVEKYRSAGGTGGEAKHVGSTYTNIKIYEFFGFNGGKCV